MSIGIDQATKKGRSKNRRNHNANGSFILATNLPKSEKEAEKQRGCLVLDIKNKKRADADGLIDHLFGQAKHWRSKKRKGKGKPTMPTFVWLACQKRY